MIAVILAGGKGTRLGELTREIPKPMIKVGGIPVLEHQINLLKRYGIIDIIILSNYLSEIIEDYFGDGSSLGVTIRYFKEEKDKPLGTAGSLKAIEGELKEDFLVFYGDVIIDVNLRKFIKFHKNKKSEATLAVHPNNHPHDSDLMEVDSDNRIVAIHSKPHEESKYYQNLGNACLYLFSPKILKFIPQNEFSDFGKNVFPSAFKELKMYGHNTAEYIRDMGTLERLAEVERDLRSGKIRRLNSENKQKAIFLDRDGVINEEINLLHKLDDFKLLPNVINAIKGINNSEYLTIVVTNQPVIARNLCTLEELNEIHKKMETVIGIEGAKIDKIYFCPHHPDRGYPGENVKYKTECSCRKPKTGMIERAIKDYNIDVSRSYIIGDSWRDIECGKRIGLKTIKTKTNHIQFDKKGEEDFSFNNLFEAVEFILKTKEGK